ncbi:hypothetical protein pb186bvf_011704 [Paramecium bursaria]
MNLQKKKLRVHLTYILKQIISCLKMGNKRVSLKFIYSFSFFLSYKSQFHFKYS